MCAHCPSPLCRPNFAGPNSSPCKIFPLGGLLSLLPSVGAFFLTLFNSLYSYHWLSGVSSYDTLETQSQSHCSVVLLGSAVRRHWGHHYLFQQREICCSDSWCGQAWGCVTRALLPVPGCVHCQKSTFFLGGQSQTSTKSWFMGDISTCCWCPQGLKHVLAYTEMVSWSRVVTLFYRYHRMPSFILLHVTGTRMIISW